MKESGLRSRVSFFRINRNVDDALVDDLTLGIALIKKRQPSFPFLNFGSLISSLLKYQTPKSLNTKFPNSRAKFPKSRKNILFHNLSWDLRKGPSGGLSGVTSQAR